MVARQLDEQLARVFPVGRRLRVLDVGMGRGAQALRLARLGHQVTGVERDPRLIATARGTLAEEPDGIRERVRLVQGEGRDTGVHFLPGSFDVVLCHGVLMHVEEPDPLVAGLARMLAPGGLLSLLVRNGDALAMTPGLTGDWTGALTALDSTALLPRSRSEADGGTPAAPAPEGRADRLSALTATLHGIAAPLHTWYGVHVFAGRTPGAPAPVCSVAPDALETLLAVEERAGRTDPYRGVAELLHLCGVRG
ncbi:class I SAM-dependent methyltransferase [Streptomyces sp. NPDC058459]|uniref:class I SAM-dependent methyltransferase n=1 Tax=Streptomyces sp. NPDC058459 TaxID=3346508 RepID=UPI0036690770